MLQYVDYYVSKRFLKRELKKTIFYAMTEYGNGYSRTDRERLQHCVSLRDPILKFVIIKTSYQSDVEKAVRVDIAAEIRLFREKKN